MDHIRRADGDSIRNKMFEQLIEVANLNIYLDV